MPQASERLRAEPSRVVPRGRLGLSGKLLLLTIPLVMIAEVLIYVPAIANFRMNRLNDRIAAANTAALVLDAAPSGMVPESLARQILNSIDARAVAIKMGQQRRMLASANLPSAVDHDVDMREMTAWQAIVGAFETMLERGDETIRVIGPAPGGAQFIEVVIDELPLRRAMYRFSGNLLLFSLGIAVLTAALVYFALHFLFVRPMRRLTANMVGFHQNPENPDRIILPSRRGDEIGVAERELSDMQRDLVSMLHQKSRLAALGLAVSKINHDLRNLLASSQLISDQLAGVPDPRVQRFAPKLVRSLERAIALCQSTLSYGRAQEAAPDRRMVLVEPIVNEVRESAGLGSGTGAQAAGPAPIGWINAIERGLTIDADPDQLFRVLLNLVRNAKQALESLPETDLATRQIRITGRREGTVAVIEISDTGPGVPQRARDHLFEAFQASDRAGGTGLGLAIAAELVRAHGGDIHLVEGTIGATFRIAIPDRPVELASLRGERIRA
ncbi:MAG: HAMP domain-containing histidine kinase [Xanthobacteraceae bacterium]|nr:HAMP domain-containing histidine kinase [Xanthobacteraceae bacterium]